MSADHRKADTQRKIQLGGLIIKAGISELDRPALMGALLLSKRLLETGDGLAEARKLGFEALRSDNPAGGAGPRDG